jgi:hypothetical protein
VAAEQLLKACALLSTKQMLATHGHVPRAPACAVYLAVHCCSEYAVCSQCATLRCCYCMPLLGASASSLLHKK